MTNLPVRSFAFVFGEGVGGGGGGGGEVARAHGYYGSRRAFSNHSIRHVVILPLFAALLINDGITGHLQAAEHQVAVERTGDALYTIQKLQEHGEIPELRPGEIYNSPCILECAQGH